MALKFNGRFFCSGLAQLSSIGLAYVSVVTQLRIDDLEWPHSHVLWLVGYGLDRGDNLATCVSPNRLAQPL